MYEMFKEWVSDDQIPKVFFMKIWSQTNISYVHVKQISM